jgi:small conductance mechanosensitive channel
MWQLIQASFADYWQNSMTASAAPLLIRLILALIMAGLTLFVARSLSRSVRNAVNRAAKEPDLALMIGRLVHLGVSGLGAGWILSVLGVPLAALAGFFGFFGLGLSMSLADVIKSLIAGVYLLIERPYWRGDRVAVRGMEGTVELMRLRTTYIRLADGRLAVIPNTIMLTDAVICGVAANTTEAEPQADATAAPSAPVRR